jgi:predicted nucleotidyltransferase
MDSPRPPDFSAFIAEIAREVQARGIPFMLIGGQAVLLHGRPRLTEDIDITLGADPTRLSEVLDVCTALELRPLPEDVEEFVRRTFVLPAHHTASGIRVDFVFSTTPYEREAIGRATFVELAGASVPFASAEDLIIHKLFAGRPRDLEDAATVARRKGSDLDWAYLEKWVQEFATVPGRELMPEQLAGLRAQADSGAP